MAQLATIKIEPSDELREMVASLERFADLFEDGTTITAMRIPDDATIVIRRPPDLEPLTDDDAQYFVTCVRRDLGGPTDRPVLFLQEGHTLEVLQPST